MKKTYIFSTLLIIGLFVLPQRTEAAFLKDFFRSIFGGRGEQVMPTPTPLPTVAPAVIQGTVLSATKEVSVDDVASDCGDVKRSVSQIVTYGMYNRDVSTVQEALVCRGYLQGPADGHYGKMTLTAVATFQRDNNISGNGMLVGEQTLKALNIELTESFNCTIADYGPIGSTTIPAGGTISVYWDTSGCATAMVFTNAINYFHTVAPPADIRSGTSVIGPFFASQVLDFVASDEAGCIYPSTTAPGVPLCQYRFATSNVSVTVLNQQTANLTLTKSVQGGGPDGPNAWTLTATEQGGPGLLTGTSGVSGSVPAGTYNLTEVGPGGYGAGPWSCTGSGVTLSGNQVTVSNGANATCGIVNTYTQVLPPCSVSLGGVVTRSATSTITLPYGTNNFYLTWTSNGCNIVMLDGAPVQLNSTGYWTGPLTATHTYILTGTNVPGCTTTSGFSTLSGLPCESARDDLTVIVGADPGPCTINSFITPPITSLGSGLSIPVTWDVGGCTIAEAFPSYAWNFNGAAWSQYTSTGSHTFSLATIPYPYNMNGDTTAEVVIVAGKDPNTLVSSTHTVAIVDTPSPSPNQCTISSLTASPNPTTGPVTINWTVPANCQVTLYRFFRYGNGDNSIYTEHFNYSGSGSHTMTMNQSSVFLVRAVGGTSVNGVTSDKTIDVIRQ